MKAIHKYQMGNERSTQSFNLKKGYKIVRSEYILTEKSVFLWIEEPLSVDIETQAIGFRMAMSGDPIADNCEHVATAIDSFGPEAYHVFEIGQASKDSIHLNAQTGSEQKTDKPNIRAA
jgi:hypothetical protein